MNEVGSAILRSVGTLLNERLKNLTYDRTFKSTVWEKNSDGTYKISYMGQL